MAHFSGHTVKTKFKVSLELLAACFSTLLLVGCAGTGDHTALELRAVMPDAQPAKAARELTVAVAAFEDASPRKERLGSRSHLWGSVSYFDLAGGKAGEAMAKLVGDYLKNRGWRVVNADSPAQVTISGKILELSVDAKSSFGSTDLTAAAMTAMEAVNATDGSTIRMTLTGKGAQDVFWFDPMDAQTLLGKTVSESLEELIASTKVEDNVIRLK